MTQEDVIDQHLSELRQEMGEALLMVNIYVDLRQNRAHFLCLLHGMLRGLTEHVQAALNVLPAEDVDGTQAGQHGPLTYVRLPDHANLAIITFPLVGKEALITASATFGHSE